MKTITIGSKVKIKDGSYMATKNMFGDIKHSSKKIPVIGWNKDIWEVIYMNVPFPSMGGGINGLDEHHNNCLIKNTLNGEYWFCSFINIKITGS